jgi:pre-rRNA-processing protein RIX1
MSISLPPDLQVLCRRLASTEPDDLPRLCPSLLKQIQRCGVVLSQPSDQKPKEGSSESSVLVHKLKTQIATLLNNGRSLPGRFSAAVLIKGIIDVGGWECLRTSEPWVRGLLSMLQVRDENIKSPSVHSTNMP